MIERRVGLYTDMYELTMAQAYFKDGTAERPAAFDYFFRKIPYQGGYVVFAGLGDVLELLGEFSYSREDIDYLRSLRFDSEFLDYLKAFRFRGSVLSVREGEVVFPVEPILRVEGGLLEAQVVETLILNILNYESLIATKASRLRQAAGPRLLSEFGLRRAPALGGIQASRAAIIGGCDTTSNLWSARHFGLKPAGTMAHSYIESYGDELRAFRIFAETYPETCIFLVDTYNTISSGLPKAIAVAKEMAGKGRKLLGVRLDSGDLAYLSRKAREMLDEAGLHEVKIIASNLLDEHLIRSLLEQGAPIDVFGVGTKLVSGHPDGALDGVYKLCEADGNPRLKLSETLAKITLPGRKKVYRYSDDGALFRADAIALAEEMGVPVMHHPFEPDKSLDLRGFKEENLFHKVMEDGRSLLKGENVEAIAGFARERLARLPPEHTRFENPHVYKIGLSRRLLDLRSELVQNLRKGF